MVKRSVFEELHGLDESFAVGLNDIDFCLRARALGKLVVFTPEACLYHYESKSRGLENTPEKKGASSEKRWIISGNVTEIF